MECEICFLSFNSSSRRPKVLPCGHSACLACLERLRAKKCPSCRTEFSKAAKDLPDNFSLLKASDTISRQVQMWCSCCGAIAQSECLANHNLKSVCAVLKSEIAQLQLQEVKLVEKLTKEFSEEDQENQDCTPERALQVLRLARQPGASFKFTARGPGGGEALKANWTNAPAAPGADVEAVEAVMAGLLGLALAKKGCLQENGKGKRDAEEPEEADGGGKKEGELGAETKPGLLVMESLRVDSNLKAQERERTLQRLRQHRDQLRRLIVRDCSLDDNWSQQLLHLAAPYVEELWVRRALGVHLLIVHAMPKLKRLKMYGDVTDTSYPILLPPLPAHRSGLTWLMVAYLPIETTFSLVQAHSTTLEELWLFVGTGHDRTWPKKPNWKDFPPRLGQCNFSNLRQLVLARPSSHDENRCLTQLKAIRTVLPRVQVKCDVCDHVPVPF